MSSTTYFRINADTPLALTIGAGKYSKKSLAERITEQMKMAFEQAGLTAVGEFEFKFKGQPRGKRTEGGKKSPKTKRKIDAIDFEPEYDEALWRFNGLKTYIQSVRVVKSDFNNAPCFNTFNEAVAEALKIYNEWDYLKEAEPEHAIFKSKKWSLHTPPVGGICRNRTTYAIRKSPDCRPWEQAPACAKKLNKDGEPVEGLASWSLRKALEQQEIVLASKPKKSVKKQATEIVVGNSGSEAEESEPEPEPVIEPERSPSPAPAPSPPQTEADEADGDETDEASSTEEEEDTETETEKAERILKEQEEERALSFKPSKPIFSNDDWVVVYKQFVKCFEQHYQSARTQGLEGDELAEKMGKMYKGFKTQFYKTETGSKLNGLQKTVFNSALKGVFADCLDNQ
jgi:hypothetical protein